LNRGWINISSDNCPCMYYNKNRKPKQRKKQNCKRRKKA
jgi:hypothetical protein